VGDLDPYDGIYISWKTLYKFHFNTQLNINVKVILHYLGSSLLITALHTQISSFLHGAGIAQSV
jgi:hypothetical protein